MATAITELAMIGTMSQPPACTISSMVSVELRFKLWRNYSALTTDSLGKFGSTTRLK